MRAEPKVYRYSGAPVTQTTADGGVWIECTVDKPPSMAGRSVDVYVNPELAVALLKEFRSAGIRARERPEGSKPKGSDT